MVTRVRKTALFPGLGVGVALILIALGLGSVFAKDSTTTVANGDRLEVVCANGARLTTKTLSRDRVRLTCATIAGATATPNPPTATPTPHDHSGTGVCGEAMDRWHPPVVNGCATGHEHGDAPPAWIAAAGYDPKFAGHFKTSPQENTLKHAGMKGLAARFSGVDIYFRIHAASNPLDRSARYHSYEMWARDGAGGVSHWQGWFDSGDPVTAREPRLQETGQRPQISVVDQAAWDAYIRCEQWYFFTSIWSWDIGWTICGSTTIYQPNENATAANLATWVLAPDGNVGNTRRLEASWYAFREHPTGKFYATQFGEIVSGPTDARCSGTTTKFNVTYPNQCLEQYIAPTMTQVSFETGNAIQRDFPATGVKVPN
ncbi:MAG: hypothetical protein ACKVVT_09320 [Dehalococcoidia bacterium]